MKITDKEGNTLGEVFSYEDAGNQEIGVFGSGEKEAMPNEYYLTCSCTLSTKPGEIYYREDEQGNSIAFIALKQIRSEPENFTFLIQNYS